MGGNRGGEASSISLLLLQGWMFLLLKLFLLLPSNHLLGQDWTETVTLSGSLGMDHGEIQWLHWLRTPVPTTEGDLGWLKADE